MFLDAVRVEKSIFSATVMVARSDTLLVVANVIVLRLSVRARIQWSSCAVSTVAFLLETGSAM